MATKLPHKVKKKAETPPKSSRSSLFGSKPVVKPEPRPPTSQSRSTPSTEAQSLWPFPENKHGRKILRLIGSKLFDVIGCYDAEILAGGTIKVLLTQRHEPPVFISPQSYSVAQIANRHNVEILAKAS